MADAAPDPQPASPADVVTYFNGERTLFGDPHALRRLLRLHLPGDYTRTLEEAAYKPPPGQEPDSWRRQRAESAATELLEAARKAFRMKGPDADGNGGATDEQTVAARHEFIQWWEKNEV